ncbi:MAG: LapA family protein [Clostridiaceae bacterium]|nr:LapA family protein [Clostridiaceae bacterium]MBW4858637.1 LapA family protein [Clostridiaceae bacterium]MBW4868096.1 LapA family protein [Clostridiaceae bacterium]
MQRGFIFSLLFAIMVAVFALKNANKVLIDFIFAKVNVSQALVILISAILGAIIVAIMGSVKKFKLKRKVKELNKKIESIDQEKKELMLILEEQNREELAVDKENDMDTKDGDNS